MSVAFGCGKYLCIHVCSLIWVFCLHSGVCRHCSNNGNRVSCCGRLPKVTDAGSFMHGAGISRLPFSPRTFAAVNFPPQAQPHGVGVMLRLLWHLPTFSPSYCIWFLCQRIFEYCFHCCCRAIDDNLLAHLLAELPLLRFLDVSHCWRVTSAFCDAHFTVASGDSPTLASPVAERELQMQIRLRQDIILSANCCIETVADCPMILDAVDSGVRCGHTWISEFLPCCRHTLCVPYEFTCLGYLLGFVPACCSCMGTFVTH